MNVSPRAKLEAKRQMVYLRQRLLPPFLPTEEELAEDIQLLMSRMNKTPSRENSTTYIDRTVAYLRLLARLAAHTGVMRNG
jgi:hypothetical protein